MSIEDPFFVVKEEVQKAIQTSQSLHDRWSELKGNPKSVSKEELEWTTSELRNSLRSIEWDLEDLEETVGIVERNPKKFKIDQNELLERRAFIDRSKAIVKRMKDELASPQAAKGKEDGNVRQALLTGQNKQYDKYTRLDQEMERSNQRYLEDTHQQQQTLIRSQDDQLDMIGSSVGVLKNMSHQIGNELEEQNLILDEFGHEMDNTESRMDTTMKKMAKVMHMSNDRRQWCAIGVLLFIILIIILLFIVL
ncbi:syntaxin-6-like [Crassostrea virginica]|uniref:Syntaxin-6-like n=1 Tax=Crassostrea virginica TaxID=6565 RepID=A0A8B8DBZ1_CRAVI|nr:syntaxin-6-like [Crassostrea virginica]XP_022325617.1 syntaxin-6-like [Crassostrea virginica]